MRVFTTLVACSALVFLAGAACKQGRAPLAQPDEQAHDRAYWTETLGLPDDCDGYASLNDDDTGIEEYGLEDNASLVLATCFRAAYQNSYLLFRHDKNTNSAEPLALNLYKEGPGGEPITDLVTQFAGLAQDDFAATGNEIDLFAKFAGHGGCGEHTRHRWNAGARRYDLIEATGYFACTSPLPPEEWPDLMK